ncbi:hypothetical protein SDC9_194920 [bioreactor metagenome]|uniref:Uncharacterized protein n=1 Tax=bioreactor metagenome TaxID=1076179 RepID=A0A645I7T0_9ZZZZ
MEANVLEEYDFAFLHVVNRGLHRLPDAVVRHPDTCIRQEFAQALSNGGKRKLGGHAFRATKVGAKDDLRFVVKQILNRRERGDNALVVSNFAFGSEGNVEVHTHKHAFPCDINILNCFLRHGGIPPYFYIQSLFIDLL